MPASIFNGSSVKILKDSLKFKSGTRISSGNDDPSVTPTDGLEADVYISTLTNKLYVKKDNGSSTNWENLVDTFELSTELNAYVLVANIGVPSGVASLDAFGKLTASEVPAIAITDTFVVASQAAQTALTAEVGDVAIRTDENKTYILQASPASTFANWVELLFPTGAVSSVFGRTGAVTAQNGDYTASQVTNVPSGNLAATEVQAALNELQTDIDGRANTALGNLASVAINASLLPATDNTINLGSAAKRYTTGYMQELRDAASALVYSITGRTLYDTAGNASITHTSATEVSVNGRKVTNLGTPVAGTDATTKDYADLLVTSSDEITNLGLASSVGSNALTIALKQSDGTTDPSTGTASVKVGMRSSTLTSGQYTRRSATAATSIVISSGSTLGQANALASVIYIYLLDNAGTLELAVSSTLYNENQLITTVAEGGAGAADSRSTIYSTTARTNVPFRLVGKLLNTQTTAGTWTSAGTSLHVNDFGSLLGFLPPTIQTFPTGSGTYNTPANAKYIKVRMVGGGGGGSGSGTASWGAGGNGTASTFGTTLLSAGGGTGGPAPSATGGAGGTSSLGTGPIGTALTGGMGQGGAYGSANGYTTAGSGGASFFGGAGANGAISGAGNAGATNTGGGGGGGGAGSTINSYGGNGGGAGGYVEAIITPTIAAANGFSFASFAYSVGAVGTAGTAGTNGAGGGAGGSGYIEVTEFYQ